MAINEKGTNKHTHTPAPNQAWRQSALQSPCPTTTGHVSVFISYFYNEATSEHKQTNTLRGRRSTYRPANPLGRTFGGRRRTVRTCSSEIVVLYLQ